VKLSAAVAFTAEDLRQKAIPGMYLAKKSILAEATPAETKTAAISK